MTHYPTSSMQSSLGHSNVHEKIDVLFFQTASGSLGGGSKMLCRLLNGLDDEFFSPVLLSQRYDEVCKNVNDNVTVEIVPYRGVLDTYNEGLLNVPLPLKLAAAARIVQFNAETRSLFANADVIWCDCLRSLLTITPQAVTRQTPVIWNIGLGQPSEGVRKHLNSIGLRTADHVFIESWEQADRVFTPGQYERHEQKFTVFRKGIDTQVFAPTNNTNYDEEIRIGTAALLTPRKGLEYLIDAFAHVRKDHRDVTLYIAGEPVKDGDQDYVKSLHRQVRDHDTEDAIEFLGWVDDMPLYLNSLDVFVLPSLNEGIPGAVREALAMELPVIATDVGGTSEAVIDRETGLLVPPANSEAIGDALHRLLDNPGQREELRRKGRERIVSEFSIEQYIRNYESFLLSIVEGKS